MRCHVMDGCMMVDAKRRSSGRNNGSLLAASLLLMMLVVAKTAGLGCLFVPGRHLLTRGVLTSSDIYGDDGDGHVGRRELSLQEEVVVEEESSDLLNGTVSVLVLIAVTIAFEHTKEYLEELCAKEGRHMSHMLDKVFGELTVLGFLSLTTFVVTQSGFFESVNEALHHTDEHEREELLELFELVHYGIFFVMIFFLLQVIVLLKGAITTEHQWVHMDRLARKRRYQELSNGGGGDALRDLHSTSTCSTPPPWKEEELNFEALRREFILDRDVEPPFSPTPISHRVSEDTFSFGLYLSISLGNLLSHVVHVQQATWIFFAVMTLAHYAFSVAVKENVVVLAWTWIVLGCSVSLFNKFVFERHLRSVRRAFFAPADNVVDNEAAADDNTHTESTELLRKSDGSLPAWCHVDLDAYLQSRPWLTKCLVGGKPDRQQSLYWLDQKGPQLYMILLQINLVFTGLYCGMHLLSFAPYMMKHQTQQKSLYIYIIFATLPILGMTFNKQNLVAVMSQVCSLGVYRRPQVVSAVLREEKTALIVRSFIILYKLRQIVKQPGGVEDDGNDGEELKKKANSRKRDFDELEIAEISKAFDSYDLSGDGKMTPVELGQLASHLGAVVSETDLRKIIDTMDLNNSGWVSKAEFLEWYASSHDEDQLSEHERAKTLFSMFDQNGSGTITIGEFKHKVDALHAGLTFDDVGVIVNELDEDNSGSIGLAEFETLIHKYYPKELR